MGQRNGNRLCLPVYAFLRRPRYLNLLPAVTRREEPVSLLGLNPPKHTAPPSRVSRATANLEYPPQSPPIHHVQEPQRPRTNAQSTQTPSSPLPHPEIIKQLPTAPWPSLQARLVAGRLRSTGATLPARASHGETRALALGGTDGLATRGGVGCLDEREGPRHSKLLCRPLLCMLPDFFIQLPECFLKLAICHNYTPSIHTGKALEALFQGLADGTALVDGYAEEGEDLGAPFSSVDCYCWGFQVIEVFADVGEGSLHFVY
ncbi:hypothetical protein EJ06DRAFT_204760 [Trichodelitschia bisporula]|uniref:Uncharacterized protein n=1 Tax=Trichodelitschia bisporula TaxID=703511 RepID=A0A6G1I807_9PEZI|nr:hypothetical protein EJ06DRAFT_204760 [Trichodelitschia bisporula]